MKVLKRNGTLADVRFDEITDRIAKLCTGLDSCIDPVTITQDISRSIHDGITTSELDQLTAEFCAVKALKHPDYGTLAARIAINDHQKNVLHYCPNFIDSINGLWGNYDKHGKHIPLISKDIYDICERNQEFLNQMIRHDRDFDLDYFGFKTLHKSYFLRNGKKILETPQYMFLRVSLGIHMSDIHNVCKTYNYMSQKYFIHATPTLFNAGNIRPQLSSCFVLYTDDSVEGIYKTITDCARISKWSGGIGVHISNIRANNSYINGTGGRSDGILPMLRVYNDTARYINQGGKRFGSFAMYLEPWHADIFEFLNCKKNHGAESQRARDLFYGLWIPDLFMKRVRDNATWSLMCPNESPGLPDVYADKFNELYERYEKEGKFIKQIPARELFNEIINSQIETGGPYMAYKDAVNNKSNQKNIGTIKSSNLCCEINIYSDNSEYSVCNLASISLPKFVSFAESGEAKPSFDFDKLREVAHHVTENLNRVIDINFYPTEETKNSNLRHRPIGIGVQGLADTFMMMRIPFDSKEAEILNQKIFEVIYYGAIEKSVELARKDGPYSSFQGSPFSQGKFQFDLCKEFEADSRLRSTPQGVDLRPRTLDGGLDWEKLRRDVMKYGTRNSLLTSVMPTASTSQILGNYECIEMPTSNIYKRRTLAGEFPVVNKHLLKDLLSLGLWDTNMQYQIIKAGGSIQNIPSIPQNIKDLYKTMWEIRQRVVINLSAQRSMFIDQSQSLNLFFENPDFNLLYSAHFYGWDMGLKTGSYYIRSKAAVDSDDITNVIRKDKEEEDGESACASCTA